MVGDHASQMLEDFVFVFYRALQPVLTVQIENDPALVKAVMAVLKFRLYNKGKIFVTCFHLQDRSVIIAEMIIGPLPQIRVRFGDNLDPVLFN